jgi:hypothetical protein
MTFENWSNYWKSIRSVCYSPGKRPKTHKTPQKCLILQICAHPGWCSKIGPSAENRSRVCAIAHRTAQNRHFHTSRMALENWLEYRKPFRSVCCSPRKLPGWRSKISLSAENRSRVCAIAYENSPK